MPTMTLKTKLKNEDNTHKITLYRFNQGANTIAGGLKSEQGAEPPGPLTLTTDHARHPKGWSSCASPIYWDLTYDQMV